MFAPVPHQGEASDELAAGRPLEVFKHRGGDPYAGGYKLLGRQFGLEPRESRARAKPMRQSATINP